MAFSDETINLAWARSEGRCECKRTMHDHFFRCSKLLSISARGREEPGAWEAHHTNSTGGDSLSNCEILCWSCHKKTQSMGG